MNENTINADVTMGGATGTLLAGRYRVVKQLGQGGMGSVIDATGCGGMYDDVI